MPTQKRSDQAAPALITLVAVVTYLWNVDRNGWSNHYYAATVRSMGTGWRAFRFATVDAGGWVTVDKPPLSLWLGSLSTRIFGFHPWSVMLPSALLAGASVWLLMDTVRLVTDRAAALLSGVLLATTPIVVALARSNLPDVTMTFFAVLAAWASVRGFTSPAWRWPLLFGASAAAGFLAKSVAIGLVLPGIGIAYLLTTPGTWPARIKRAVAAAGVSAGIVALWLWSVDGVASAARPWIGGSKDGTAWGLVFGYHTSFFGGEGGLPPGFGRGPGPLAGLFMVFGGERGIGRLFNDGMGDQVMWWFPLAALGLVAACVGRDRWRSHDPLVGAGVLWGLWTLVSLYVLSFTKGVLHPYYVVVLAPPLAALAAIGLLRVWRAHERVWLAAGGLALLATTALQVVLLRRNPSYPLLRWIVPVGIAAAGSAALLRRVRLRRDAETGDVIGRTSAFALVAVLLLAPVLWSAAAVRQTVGGLFPAARPGTDSFSFGPPNDAPVYGWSDFSDATLRWLDRQRTTERWTIAMSSAMVADDAIIAGRRVMPMGGFGGTDLAADADRVGDVIATGQLRYVLAGGATANGLSEPEVFGAIRDVCTQVPSSAWGGDGVSGVYDCRGKGDAIRGSTP